MLTRVVAVVLVACFTVGCGCEGANPGAPGGGVDAVVETVPEEELPAVLTIEAEPLGDDVPTPPVVRSVRLELVSPYDVPLDGLRFGRLEPVDGAEWPAGWKVLPGTMPFGTATDGIPAGRRFTWFASVVRTDAGAPVSREFRFQLEHRGPDGATRTARSNEFTLAFPPAAAAQPLSAADLQGAASEVLVTVSEFAMGEGSRSVALGPDGRWIADSAAGRLDDEARARLREVLREAQVWALLDGEDADIAPSPERARNAWLTVSVTAGGGHALRRLDATDLRDDPRWDAFLEYVEDVTGVQFAE